MPRIQKITLCLWFDDQAEEAARFYTGIFGGSRILHVSRYAEAGRDVHGKEPGSAMTVDFELEGQRFTALNGGPLYRFTEATSLMVGCETQKEVDHYWNELSQGGDESAQQCGWLKDRFGLSWQIVPDALPELIGGPDPVGSQRAMQAMFQMRKLDVEALRRAYAGS